MPLLKIESLGPATQMGIWKIEETPEVLKAQAGLNPGEQKQYESFKSEIRKKQWLSYRLLLKKMLPDEAHSLYYNTFGKPFLENSGMYLSISHSGDYSAVITSRTCPVGIDIERLKDRIHRIYERFLTPGEDRAIGETNRLEKLYIAWGAKEALYKIHGKPEVDFQHDIHIGSFDYLCRRIGQCSAMLNMPDGMEEYDIFYERISDYMLVYALKMNTER
jgi:4'-phosphopantetheinyl transferase